MPQLSAPVSRSSLVRGLAAVLAAGALATACAVAPAAAHDGRGSAPGPAPAVTGTGTDGAHGGDGRQEQGRYRGVVTAERLALRTSPARGSDVIRYARRGEVVSIYCKTPGDTVKGNPLWYLLTDGTWAWGAARYIDNVGPAPRWC
ncbi:MULTISPECIES: SH3 domain-containing protein [Streptomyces]|uniref:SH3 domain-containing protein n=1 Tax=Streptomyces TaxID=1883 RepID=UPI001CCCE6DE|nr:MULTISPECIES: SH3 domain-containing protein [Streptomyces]MBZ6140927.1 SH3 domain-containing protein [Streptomyces olivaceus]MBZ6168707.1 SH3 domain-containing protein [Streptomyces olivaceus]MCM8554562.1 SH3 domain-containing protein [Streptomyces sp. STCH 565 A]